MVIFVTFQIAFLFCIVGFKHLELSAKKNSYYCFICGFCL